MINTSTATDIVRCMCVCDTLITTTVNININFYTCTHVMC